MEFRQSFVEGGVINDGLIEDGEVCSDSASMTNYYIEKPQDDLGNRLFPAAIIEGNIVRDKSGFGYFIEVVAPEEIRSSWPRVNASFFVRLEIEAGPARLLRASERHVQEEMDDIIAKQSYGSF